MKEGRKRDKNVAMKLVSRKLIVLKDEICSLPVSVCLARAPSGPVLRHTGKGEGRRTVELLNKSTFRNLLIY